MNKVRIFLLLSSVLVLTACAAEDTEGKEVQADQNTAVEEVVEPGLEGLSEKTALALESNVTDINWSDVSLNRTQFREFVTNMGANSEDVFVKSIDVEQDGTVTIHGTESNTAGPDFGMTMSFMDEIITQLYKSSDYYEDGKEPNVTVLDVNGKKMLLGYDVSHLLGNAETEVDTKPAPEEKSTSSVGRRSNPVPLGESHTFTFEYNDISDWGKYYEAEAEVVLSNVIRGDEAAAIVAATNSFNDAPQDGYEYIIVDASIKIVQAATDDFPYHFDGYFSVITQDGSEVVQDPNRAYVENGWGGVDIYNGGQHEGKLLLTAPIDSHPSVEIRPTYDTSAFFSLE